MIVWICDECGCELKEKVESCPLCKRSNSFWEDEKSDPNNDDKEISKKYEEVIEGLEKYTEKCEPEKAKYSLED